VDGCNLEGNLSGGVTGNLIGSSITGCYFEGTPQNAWIQIYLGPEGNQAARGLLIARNFFTAKERVSGSDTAIYHIYFRVAQTTEIYPVHATIANNWFHAAPTAAIFSDGSLRGSTIQDNFCEPGVQLLDIQPQSPENPPPDGPFVVHYDGQQGYTNVSLGVPIANVSIAATGTPIFPGYKGVLLFGQAEELPGLAANHARNPAVGYYIFVDPRNGNLYARSTAGRVTMLAEFQPLQQPQSRP
jgi:hypothetical protein